jgi:hypothetical protein
MNRRLLVAAVVVAVVVAVGGIAFAYWRGSGSGSRSVTTGTTVALGLGPATPTADLYPGGSTAVALTATNPNSSPIRIGSLALDTSQGTGGFGVDGGHPACGVASLSFATQNNSGSGWTITAHGSLLITLANALAMTAEAAQTCQGAGFTVYLTAGP